MLTENLRAEKGYPPAYDTRQPLRLVANHSQKGASLASIPTTNGHGARGHGSLFGFSRSSPSLGETGGDAVDTSMNLGCPAVTASLALRSSSRQWLGRYALLVRDRRQDHRWYNACGLRGAQAVVGRVTCDYGRPEWKELSVPLPVCECIRFALGFRSHSCAAQFWSGNHAAFLRRTASLEKKDVRR